MNITDKKILDVTCGGRSIWFNKNHPLAVYTDRREGDWEKRFGSNNSLHHCNIHPDIIADFRDLPFPDNSFHLVVFDPPHAEGLSDLSWIKKKYGSLDSDWREMLRGGGVDECMRVLVPYGTLIFKWAEVKYSTREVINAIGREPLFGHRSGKKMGTHWLAFMKIPEGADNA